MSLQLLSVRVARPQHLVRGVTELPVEILTVITTQQGRKFSLMAVMVALIAILAVTLLAETLIFRVAPVHLGCLMTPIPLDIPQYKAVTEVEHIGRAELRVPFIKLMPGLLQMLRLRLRILGVEAVGDVILALSPMPPAGLPVWLLLNTRGNNGT
jgi:hypothetical protein